MGKKPQGEAGKAVSTAEGGAPAVERCVAEGCKAKSARFSFCPEHYEHFKFGLIRKDGKLADDHEKKLDHFNAMRARQGATRKVA
ncbi:MAG: hypothetical protein IT285_13520 [Bdellovibrionales bacterium]|nr:hypothetical protein [Bdellovibrionales bacterium]